MYLQERYQEKYNDINNAGYKNSVQDYLIGDSQPGKAMDLAPLIHFLASEQAIFINGALINCDGGAAIQEQLSLLLENRNSSN
jgi:NAD(P)-dependent dehydrogenase (short-subunit alcohol dehydrogenase family)